MAMATNHESSDLPQVPDVPVVGGSGCNKSSGGDKNTQNCDIELDCDIYKQPKLRELYNNIEIEIERQTVASQNDLLYVAVFHKIKNRHGFWVYTCENSCNQTQLEELLSKHIMPSLPRGEELYLITGTHGNKRGQNYEKQGNEIAWRTSLQDMEFYDDNIMFASSFEQINVFKAHDLKFNEMAYILNGEMGNHVLLDYCYSFNDAIFRYFFQGHQIHETFTIKD